MNIERDKIHTLRSKVMNRTMLAQLFNKRELLKENTIKYFVLTEFGLETNHKRASKLLQSNLQLIIVFFFSVILHPSLEK